MTENKPDNHPLTLEWWDAIAEQLEFHGVAHKEQWLTLGDCFADRNPSNLEGLRASIEFLSGNGLTVPLLLFAIDELLSRKSGTEPKMGMRIVKSKIFRLCISLLISSKNKNEYSGHIIGFLQFLNNLPIPVALYTNMGLLVAANQVTLQLFGKEAWNSALGHKNIFEDEPSKHAKATKELRKCLEGKEVIIPSYKPVLETWIKKLQNREFSLYGTPLKNHKGEVSGFFTSISPTESLLETQDMSTFFNHITMLGNVAQTVGIEADLERACLNILSKLTDSTFDSAALFLVEGDEIILHSSKFFPTEIISRQSILRLGEMSVGEACKTRSIQTITADRTLSEDVRLLELTGFTSRFDVPIIFHRRTIGVLSLLSVKPILLTEELKITLDSIASQIGMGLENHNLLVKLQREANYLELERDYTQTMINAMGNAVFAINADENIAFYNERFYNITKFAGDEIVGKHWKEFVVTGHEAFMNVLAESLENNQPAFCEVMWRTSGGKSFAGFTGICPFRGPDGSLSGYVVSVADLSERKHLENLLRSQNEELMVLNEINKVLSQSFEVIEVGTELLDIISAKTGADFGVIYLWEDHLRSSLQARASVGLSDTELLNVEFMQASGGIAGRSIKTGEVCSQYEKKGDGRSFKYSKSGHRITSIPLALAGEIAGVIILGKNGRKKFDDSSLRFITLIAPQITATLTNLQLFERVKSDAAKTTTLSDVTSALLKENEEDKFCSMAIDKVLEAIALDSGYVIRLYDNESVLLSATPQEDRSWAENLKKVLSSRLDLLNEEEYCWIENVESIPSEEIKKLFQEIDAKSAVIVPITEGSKKTALLVLTQKLFRRRWIQSDRDFIRMISDQLGVAFGKIDLFRQLSKANSELRTLDEMKSNLLANVSHELRTPLVSIRGYVEMTLQGMLGEVSNRQEKGLQVALRNVDRLVGLIDNLLNFAKLDSGHDNLVLTPFLLDAMLQTVLRTFKPHIKEKSIRVNLECAKDIEVVADLEKLSRVATNLIDNAIKFTPEKGSIKIIGRIKTDKKTVVIEVHDSGPGIPISEREKVFERFYQVDSASTRKYGGTGIGLAICRDILRLHGGEIVAQKSTLGGAAMILSLPALKQAGGITSDIAMEQKLPNLVLLNALFPSQAEQFDRAYKKAGVNTISLSGLSVCIHGAIRHRPHVLISDLFWPEDGCFKLFHSMKGNFQGDELKFFVNGFFPLLNGKFYWFSDFYPCPIPLEYLRRLIIEIPAGGDVLLVNGYDELTDILGMLCFDWDLNLQVVDNDAGEIPPPINRYHLVLFDVSKAHRRLLQMFREDLSIIEGDLPRIVGLSSEAQPLDRDDLRILNGNGGFRPVSFSRVKRELLSILNSQEKAPENQYKKTLSKRVLLIDDEDEILELLRLILEPSGWEVFTLSSGVGASETVFRLRPDLILLDIAMPGKDGLEVLESLAMDRETADIPVVIISARTDEETKRLARAAGARSFLSKPFRNVDLLKIVEKIISKH